jgi:hypothetical protein
LKNACRLDVKTMWRPEGEKLGCVSSTHFGPFVSRRNPVPSDRITKTSFSPVRFEANTISCPSGENRG